MGARGGFFPPEPAYNSVGPYMGLLFKYFPSRNHSFTASWTGEWLWYRGEAQKEPQYIDQDLKTKRQDWPFEAQGVYGYRGKFMFQAGYSLRRVKSNSFGENHWRHRGWALFSTRLFGKTIGAMQVSYQYYRYLDGMFSQGLFLVDEESQSSITGKLSCPVWGKLEVEAKYSLQWIPTSFGGDEQKENLPEYMRQITFLGIAYRW